MTVDNANLNAPSASRATICFVILSAVYVPILTIRRALHTKPQGPGFWRLPARELKAAQTNVNSPCRRSEFTRSRIVERSSKMVDEKLKKAAIKEGEWPSFASCIHCLFAAPLGVSRCPGTRMLRFDG